MLPVMQVSSSSRSFVLSCVKKFFVPLFPQVPPVSVLRNYNLYFYVYLTRSLIRTNVDSILLNNQPDAAVCSQFYSTARLLYMFRAFYTPIIRSKISTVSTASDTNHSIVSATFFQRGLVPGHAGSCVPVSFSGRTLFRVGTTTTDTTTAATTTMLVHFIEMLWTQ